MREREAGERIAAALRAQASVPTAGADGRRAREIRVRTLLLGAVVLGAVAGLLAALVSTL